MIEAQYHGYEPDSDSDFEAGRLAPRRHSPRNHRSSRSHSSASGSHQGSTGRRYSSELTRYDDRREVVPVARHSNHSYRDSDSDDSCDSEAELAEERRARNKKLLYTGLAAMTTITCANGLYQTTKGYHIRRKTLREKTDLGELQDEIERKKHHRNHVAMNGLALVTVAISANNLRLGWQRQQEHKKKHEEAAAKAWERKHRSHKAYSVEER